MINPSQRPLPDNTQQSQQTNIHAPGGIRTHNLSRRAAEDLRLRPRGHLGRLSVNALLSLNREFQIVCYPKHLPQYWRQCMVIHPEEMGRKILRNVSSSKNKIKRRHTPEDSRLRIMFWFIHICHTVPVVARIHIWKFGYFHERILKFSTWSVGRLSYSEMWCRVPCWKFCDVSHESAVSFIWLLLMVISLLFLDLERLIYLPCWRMKVSLLNHPYTSTRLHGITLHKTLISTYLQFRGMNLTNG